MWGYQGSKHRRLLSNHLESSMRYMRRQAQYGKTSADRITATRDLATFGVGFHTMRRRFDLSHTLVSRAMQLVQGEGIIFNFHFGKGLRSAAMGAAVVRRHHDCPESCPVRAVRKYQQAALAIDWDLPQGHIFPTETSTGERGRPSPAAKITTWYKITVRHARG